MLWLLLLVEYEEYIVVVWDFCIEVYKNFIDFVLVLMVV